MNTLIAILTLTLFAIAAKAEEHWRLINPEQAYTVRVNPTNGNHIVMGSWANQVFVSTNAGKSWEMKESGSLSSPNLLTSLFWSSADPNVFLLGGINFIGIKRSTNLGDDWTTVLDDPSLRRMFFISEAIIEDPKNPSTLYGARGSTFNSVWKSTDAGATWDSISVVPTEITGRLCTITVHPDSTNVLFLGCVTGVMMRSSDYGQTWTQVPINGKLSIKPDSEIPKIVFSRRDSRVGYAVVAIASEEDWQGNGGLLKTTDGGFTWNQIAFVDTSLWSVDVATNTDGTNDELLVGGFRISSLSPSIVRGDSLVYRSTDGGQTWTQFPDIEWTGVNTAGADLANVWAIRYDTVGGRVYMATRVGLYVLDNSTSVDEESANHQSLTTFYDGKGLRVWDTSPEHGTLQWSLYSMDGSKVASGEHIAAESTTLNVGTISAGRYLLTWGNRQHFRTALVSVVH